MLDAEFDYLRGFLKERSGLALSAEKTLPDRQSARPDLPQVLR